tara:strand:+ start:183 stop:440 length:258 start_codon:yes stop_codon:yes gene_type:complete
MSGTMSITRCYVRNLPDGIPWSCDYPTRRSMDLKEEDLVGYFRVIHQHSFEEDDQFYPALGDGEVLVWHNTYGLLIFQSVDLDYR